MSGALASRNESAAPVAPRPVEGKGFRPGSRRRARIAGGAALAAAAIGGNVLLYASLDDRTEVLQVVSDVRAGELVTADDLRVVEVDLDPSVPVVRADDIGLIANRYARVHIASGTLAVPVLVQDTPLVTAGSAVVAIELRPTLVPAEIRERSLLELIVVDSDGGELRTTGRAVTRPAEVDGVTALLSMSVELDAGVAPDVAAADEVRVVLLDPGADPVYTGGEG